MSNLIFAIGDLAPLIDHTAFVAPDAVICGQVVIGPNASVWHRCVLRGDSNRIEIAERASIGEATVIHADLATIGGTPAIIGAVAIIGARCMLHGCSIGHGAVIGVGVTILDGASIGSGSVLGANSFLAPGKTIPANELWSGLPARKVRDLTPDDDRVALAKLPMDRQ